jgi:geranylgeranyl diphosphate synthase type 3
MEKKRDPIRQPVHQISENTQNELLNSMIYAFNSWIKLPENSIAVLQRIIRKVYLSSIVLDDIEDSSKLRNGEPCAHQIYGIAQTINSANFCYFEALSEVVNLGSSEAVDLFLKEMMSYHRGQMSDIIWRDHSECPTEKEYLEMVKMSNMQCIYHV